MEIIKDFTVGLVIVCVIGAVVLILTPEGSVEKQVKTAVSLVMLLCFIYPFCSAADLDFDLSVNDSADISAEELFVDAFESELISDISRCLSDSGIEAENIETVMHITEENEIIIESVTVYINRADEIKTDEIKKKIKDDFGIMCCVEVSYESED